MLRLILYILPCLMIEVSPRIVEFEVFCSPTNLSNEIEEVASLKQSYTCTGVTHISQLFDNIPEDVEEVVIQNSQIYSENIPKQMKDNHRFESLHAIQLVESFIGVSFFKWMESLQNLRSLILVGISTGYAINHKSQNMTVFELKLNGLENLQSLQISKTNITNLQVEDINKVPFLNLSDNQFECGHDFIWLLRLQERTKKVVLNNTICFMRKITHPYYPIQYTLSGKPFLSVMEYKREALDNCPPRCSCEMNGMVTVNRPQLTVECIGLNMTKLPDIIPKGSAKCNFSYNFIEDLSPMYSNNLYDKVAMMALSHNNISFLDPIKFPELLRKRRDVGFSLDHNRLQKFPAADVRKIYFEAHKKNRYMPQFFLAHNPWICSCDYIADFQDLIYQQLYEIRDSREIRCSEDDPSNPGTMVLALDVGTLCYKEVNFNILDVLNIFLGILLLVLICDFINNWRQYRKNHKLPWIVTKFKC